MFPVHYIFLKVETWKKFSNLSKQSQVNLNCNMAITFLNLFKLPY